MGKEESLASYHFWKHQYVSRNESYIRFNEIRNEVREIFEVEGGGLSGEWDCLLLVADVDEAAAEIGKELSVLARKMVDKARDCNYWLRQRFGLREAVQAESSFLLELAVADQLDDYVNGQNLQLISNMNLVQQLNANSQSAYLDVRIDPLGDIGAIVEEVRRLCAVSRNLLAESLCRNDLIVECHDLYDPNMLMDSIKNANSYVPVKQFHNTPRAIGLWLWDSVQRTGISNIAHHERTLKGMKSFDRTGYSKSDRRSFTRFYNLAQKCIEKGEVLKVS